MATVRIGPPVPVGITASIRPLVDIDMRYESVFDLHDAYPTYSTTHTGTATPAAFAITSGYYGWTYQGEGFTYSLNGTAVVVVGGTVTSYLQIYSGPINPRLAVASATGLNVAAATAYQLIQSNNGLQLDALALSGNDTIYGSGGSDVLMGYGGNNTFIGMSRSQIVGAHDYVAYSGVLGAYSISVTSTGFVVSRPDGGQDALINIEAIKFSDQTVSLLNLTSDIKAIPTVSSGLLGNLNIGEQLELIYIAYFNRAADGGGNTFWGQQNVQAQAAGQSAAIALTNIANSFTPQQETIALYPFLGTPKLNLNTPAAQAGLTAFISSVYSNLFNRVAEQDGTNYWVGQITGGAVGLGAAALAIANGATGSDAIEVQNKVAVALDFTNRTSAAGLGTVAPLPASFVAAARGILSGVDGTSLNDASVTEGMIATTVFITGPRTGHVTAAATNAESPIIISVSNAVIDPGAGGHTISFLAGASADTLVLHAGGVDEVSGFDPGTDVLDLRTLLSEANVSLTGGVGMLSKYLTIVDQGTDALVSFTASGGQGGSSTVAVLHGLGSTVTSLDSLVAQGAIRIS